MSEAETRKLVEQCAEAFNKADLDDLLACLSEDVALDRDRESRRIGRDKMRWYLGERARHFRETIGDMVVMVAEGGGRAAAEFTLRGTYLSTVDELPEASGQSYSVRAGIFFDIEDGRISRVTPHCNRADLEAELSRG